VYLGYEADDVAAMAAAAISAVFLIVVSIAGIVVSIKEKEGGLGQFGVAMISMFVWGLIQLILVILSYDDCGDGSNPLTFICHLTRQEAIAYYFFPASLLLIANLCGGTFGCLLKKEIENEN